MGFGVLNPVLTRSPLGQVCVPCTGIARAGSAGPQAAPSRPSHEGRGWCCSHFRESVLDPRWVSPEAEWSVASRCSSPGVVRFPGH